MKKTLILLAVLTITLSTFAQSPEEFNYQAVIRDASNNILSNQNVGIQFRLLQGSSAGTSAYSETHTATTDTYGLVALTIGTGTSSDDFTTIDWANGPYFLEIAADVTGGTTYSVLGTQQLMSVPYALYAKTSGSTSPSDAITDTDNDTKIQVEATTDEDIIRFSVAGTEQLTIDSNRIVIQDTLQYIDGNQATDNILISDANGNATWSNIQSLGLFDGITVDDNTNDIDCLEITETAALPDMGNNKGILVEDNIFYSVGEIASLGIPDYSLVMFDISDANNPVFLGDVLLPTTGGSNGKTLIKAGNMLYVAMNGYINAVDVSDPSNPILLDAFSHSAVSATNSNLRYFDSRLFFAETNGSDILQFDVSDPSNISTLPNFTLVNTGATLLSMDIADGKLYYTDQSTGFPMHIFDITATTEQFLGTSTVATFGNSYFLIDNGYAYIYDKLTDNKLKIINVSDPTNTQLVSELSIISNQSEVYITKYNNLLIVVPGTAGGATGIEIIDVSDPANPIGYGILYGTELGVISSFEEYVYVDNTKLYVYASDNDAILTFELNCLGATVGVAYNPNTGAFESIEDLDEQSLSLSGTNLSISNGNTVNLSSINTTQILITDADNDTKIQVEESGDEDMIRFDIAGTQRMILDNNGFVGIGTSNPTANLTVMGAATTNTEITHFSNSNNAKKAIISLSNTGAGQIVLLDGTNNTDVLLSASDNSYFNTANLGVGNNNPQEKLHITGNIRMEDGNQGIGKVMTSDANGTATWQTVTSASNTISDADNDTKIQVEESANEDVIRFDIAGTEQMVLSNTTTGEVNLVLNPTTSNTYIGKSTGNVTTGVANVFLGNFSGEANTTGSFNTYVGNDTGRNNQDGEHNLFIGRASGFLNINGSGNVFIGDSSGYFEPGSNKLFISNSNTISPLIYGEFDTKLLRINGTLDVNGAVKIGTNGTALTNIIKVTTNIDLPNISSNNVLHQTVSVSGAKLGATVFVSTENQLAGSLMIGNCRVSGNNTVEITILNEGSNGQNMAAMDFYITVIQ